MCRFSIIYIISSGNVLVVALGKTSICPGYDLDVASASLGVCFKSLPIPLNSALSPASLAYGRSSARSAGRGLVRADKPS